MSAHVCEGCGMLHDMPVQIENPEVAIARINAESALKIAQLSARAETHAMELMAETDLAITELHTEGDLAETALVAEALVEGVEPEPEVEPAPVVVMNDNDNTDEPTGEAPDLEDTPTPRKSGGFGMWGV